MILGLIRVRDHLRSFIDCLYRCTALLNRFTATSDFYASSNGMLKEGDLERIVFPPSEADQRLLCLVHKHGDASGPHSNPPTSEDMAGSFGLMPLPERSSPATGNLMTHWNLDAASALAVHLLNVQPGDNVLDLCASPGGKSIAIAQMLWPQLHQDKPNADHVQGSLCCNEHDSTRFKRLNENLRHYLPAQLFTNKQVTTMKIDGSDSLAYRKLSIGPQGYDKVLVDAPCSSERHLIHESSRDLTNWRPGSSKRLAQTQTELLMTGLRSVKVGGYVLYATCSIEMAENDGVVEKVLALVEKEVKKGAKWSVKLGFNGGDGDERLEKELEKGWAERTKYGWIVLPGESA